MAHCPPREVASERPDSARDTRALAPEAFGPFQVLEQIGAGALGPVYSALQPEIDCLVAVKQFTLGIQSDRAQRVLAQFDAFVPAGLDHLGIAAAIGTGIGDGSPYLIQELARGTSLARLGDEGRTLSVPDVARLSAHVAEAIDFAARAGIDHGGLKPSDIIVTGADARVTGFGVVRALERAGVLVPARAPYAAPERVAAQVWDGRSDTFSLAAIAFELLYGDAVSTLEHDILERIGPLEGADVQALQRVFGRALAADPADRFESATAFAQALHDACEARLGDPGPFRRRKPFAFIPRPQSLESRQRPLSPEPRVQAPEVEPVESALPSGRLRPSLPTIEVEDALRAAGADGFRASTDHVGDATDDLTGLLAAIESAILAAPAETSKGDTDRGSGVVPDRGFVLADVETAAVVAVQPKRRRRYSIYWPLVCGAATGVAIGLLALTYVGHPPRPLSQQERLIRDRQRRAQPPPTRDRGLRLVHLPGAGTDRAGANVAAVAVLARDLTAGR